jgi:hypothetical protein
MNFGPTHCGNGTMRDPARSCQLAEVVQFCNAELLI